jgi:6-phosphogluconolactonase (cycloisomerase 2 family)
MSTPLFVGTAGFGAEDPHTILKLRLAHADGTLAVAGQPTKTAGQNPGWLLVPPGTGSAFVGMEDEAGSVQAYAIDPDDPSNLSEVGERVSSVGQHPCSLAIDASGKWLLVRQSAAALPQPQRSAGRQAALSQRLAQVGVAQSGRLRFMLLSFTQAANYSSASIAVLPINDDGSVGAATDSKAHHEQIDPMLEDRQEMAHPHCILPNPYALGCPASPSSGSLATLLSRLSEWRAFRRVHAKWVAVCDLGLSAVFIYELDAVNGALIGAADNPRHMRCERLAPPV